MTLESPIELDSLDLKLIAELVADARKSYKDIANSLDMARSTVAFRIQRLLHNNIISITCWTDPLALGYKFFVTFNISTKPNEMYNVADRLAACPAVLGVSLCTGRFDIVVWALFRDNAELKKFNLEVLGSIPYIMQVEKMLILREAKLSFNSLETEKESHPRLQSMKELDHQDILLIRELQINPNISPGSLARKFGLYESNIRRRIHRLIDQNIIRIKAFIDPVVLGYEYSALIEFKCNPDKVREVAEMVASYNNIFYVGICAGRYDVSTYGVFKNLNDLEKFVTFQLGKIPGLVYAETTVVHQIVKRMFQVPV